MIALEPTTQRKLIASLRLLGSDKEGERQAALNAAMRLLPPGVTLADVVERSLGAATLPAPDPVGPTKPITWQAKARAICGRAHLLKAKELRFVQNIAFARFEPTQKQMEWLNDLAERVGVGQ